MGEETLTALTHLAETAPLLLLVLAFLVAFLESLAIVGILVPGIILLFLIGTLIGPDWGLFLLCWLAVSSGALLGDGLSYWLGDRYRDRIPKLWPFRQRPELLAASRAQFKRHGGKAIVIARFIGPMRPVVPLIAGSLALPRGLFYFYAVPACIAWAPLYLLPGAAFGASLEIAAQFAGRLALLLAIVVIGLWLLLWLTRQVYEFTAQRSSWWLRSLIRWLRNHPRLGRLFGSLLEPGRREILSVTLLGLILLTSFAVLLAVLLAAPMLDTTWDAQRQLAGWAGSLRNHIADPLFAALALAMGERTLLLLSGMLFLVLIALGRRNAAWHWAAAVLGGWFIGEVLIRLTQRLVSQPELMPTLGEVPYRPFLLACLVLLFFAVLLAKDLSARRRKWPYLFTTLLLSLSGFAHFYLGQASLLGLLAALALGVGWVALVGIGYRSRATPRAHGLLLALLFYGFGLGVAIVNVQSGLAAMLERTALERPERLMSSAAWRQSGWQALPDRISSLGPWERSRFDLQIAGQLSTIEQRLVDQGWERVAKVRASDLWSLLAGQADSRMLPHLNRDFAGRPEDLVLRRPNADGSMALLRLWASGTTLLPDQTPVWLGQIRAVEPGWVLGSLTRWFEVDDQRDAAMQTLDSALAASWRAAPAEGPRLYAVPD